MQNAGQEAVTPVAGGRTSVGPAVVKSQVIQVDTIYFCSGSSAQAPLATVFKIAPFHSYYARTFFRPRARQWKNQPKQKQMETKYFGLTL